MKGEGRRIPSQPTANYTAPARSKNAIAGDCRQGRGGQSSPLYRKQRGITRPSIIWNSRATPRTRTRRQKSSVPYFARQSDRRLWLGRSGAFNHCAHVPTVQRLIGIYTARNPRTFRHHSSGVVLHVPTLGRL